MSIRCYTEGIMDARSLLLYGYFFCFFKHVVRGIQVFFLFSQILLDEMWKHSVVVRSPWWIGKYNGLSLYQNFQQGNIVRAPSPPHRWAWMKSLLFCRFYGMSRCPSSSRTTFCWLRVYRSNVYVFPSVDVHSPVHRSSSTRRSMPSYSFTAAVR